MDAQVLQLLIQAGVAGVSVWMLNNVWTELKVQNQRIYDLLTKQDDAKDERADMARQLVELKAQITQNTLPATVPGSNFDAPRTLR